MALLAATNAGWLPLALLVLACPLMMVFMMRGMHRQDGDAAHQAEQPSRAHRSLEELKRERDALNKQIAQRAEQEVEERCEKYPAGV